MHKMISRQGNQYHFTPTRMAIMKISQQTISNKCLVRMCRNWNPQTLIGGNVTWYHYGGKVGSSSKVKYACIYTQEK